MISLRVLLLGGALLWSATPGATEEHGGFARVLELPAHRALIERREQPGTVLTPFQSDGCSGGLSSVWGLMASQFAGFARVLETAPPWESCCVTHDRAYYDGAGARDGEASFAARLRADQQLRACVVQMGVSRKEELGQTYGIRPDQVETAFAAAGGAMFWAVRYGGGPCTGLAWRWGFGLPDCSVLGPKGDRSGSSQGIDPMRD